MGSEYFEADRDCCASLRLLISCQQRRRQRLNEIRTADNQNIGCDITQVSSFGQTVFASSREIGDVVTTSIKNNSAPIIS